MNLEQVIQSLAALYKEPLKEGEERKIVFWVDKEKEFKDELEQIAIENVKVHELTDHNYFYTKYLLEEEDKTSHYLIYTTDDVFHQDNWLIDIAYYSEIFYADKISLLLDDLRIDPSLRAVVKKYEKFFNKKHTQKLKSYDLQLNTVETLETGMISVLCNLKTPNMEEAVKTILKAGLEDIENKYILLLDKYIGVSVFWDYVAKQYGYDRKERSLKTLFIHLTVTALSQSLEESNLVELQHFIAKGNRANAFVFVDHWMHHKDDFPIYKKYAEIVEQEIKLPHLVVQLPLETIKQAEIFPYFDKAIIMYIANGLQAAHEDYEEYIELIELRRVKHFYEQFQNIYEALYYTVKMYQFYKKHRTGIPILPAKQMWQLYVEDYYEMDMFYRKFYVAFDEEPNSDILKKLKELVENLYTNWFSDNLNAHWSLAVEREMKEKWTLPGVVNQQRLFNDYIAPRVQKKERIFVIISDALRYEIGVEVAEKLEAETPGICEIEPLLSVVPSVTKLGMAALLPHRMLEFDESGNVLVDGKSSSGKESRKEIVETAVKDSLVIHAQELIAMKKAERRERIKGKKLIYIYHDTIDAVGDKAATEIYTFRAVEQAIEEIITLVNIIRTDVSGTNIYITADHGFLYERDALIESDKITKEDINALEVKRRYILAKEEKEMDGILRINLNGLIHNEQNLYAYVPKATIRFKLKGSGINFVHGGASLQEVVVPFINYKNVRKGQANSREIEKVDIKLTSTTRKITNSNFTLSFFQTERIAEKIVPRTVVVYMEDDNGAVISNEETIIGDNTSTNPEERMYELSFVLKAMPYDKTKQYYLTIKEQEKDEIIEKIPFEINLSFISDLDF